MASSILCDNTGGDTGDTTVADTEKNLTLCGLGPCLLGGGEAPPYSALATLSAVSLAFG